MHDLQFSHEHSLCKSAVVVELAVGFMVLFPSRHPAPYAMQNLNSQTKASICVCVGSIISASSATKGSWGQMVIVHGAASSMSLQNIGAFKWRSSTFNSPSSIYCSFSMSTRSWIEVILFRRI